MAERIIEVEPGQQITARNLSDHYLPNFDYVVTEEMHGGKVFGALMVMENSALAFSGGILCSLIKEVGNKIWSNDEIREGLKKYGITERQINGYMQDFGKQEKIRLHVNF